MRPTGWPADTRSRSTSSSRFRRIDPKPRGRKPSMQLDCQPSRFDRRVAIHERARLLHGLELENEHAAQIAVVGKRTGNDQLAGLRHPAEVREMPFLNAARFTCFLGGP